MIVTYRLRIKPSPVWQLYVIKVLENVLNCSIQRVRLRIDAEIGTLRKHTRSSPIDCEVLAGEAEAMQWENYDRISGEPARFIMSLTCPMTLEELA